MGGRDPRIDAYIAASADFAQPILLRLRALVHEACPAVEEGIKWGFPHFMYKGILCSMASFKQHCAFGFWQGGAVVGAGGAAGEAAMGQFGRIRSEADLPTDDAIRGYVAEAVRLKDARVKTPRRTAAKPPRAEVAVPEMLARALASHDAPRAAFERLAPSQRREYAEWVAEAKTDATRARRVATALEWIAEGKSRNWKYERR